LPAWTNSAVGSVVCERQDSGTTLERLDRERLKGWLEDYRLGQIWRRNFVGGNRW